MPGNLCMTLFPKKWPFIPFVLLWAAQSQVGFVPSGQSRQGGFFQWVCPSLLWEGTKWHLPLRYSSDWSDNNSLWINSLGEKPPANFPWKKKAVWGILVSQVLSHTFARSHWAELWTDLGTEIPPRAGQSPQCNPRILHWKKCSAEMELGLLNRVWSGKTGPSLETGLSQQPHSLLSPLLLAPSCWSVMQPDWGTQDTQRKWEMCLDSRWFTVAGSWTEVFWISVLKSGTFIPPCSHSGHLHPLTSLGSGLC